MIDYEITYISDGELPEDARLRLDSEFDDQLRQLGGSASYSAPHTPRRLFYPIKKKRAAGLRLVQVELAAENIDQLKTFLRKHAGILRFSILKTPRRPEAPQALLDQLRGKRGGRPSTTPAVKKPVRKTEVTMEEVEKGIEKALEEQVK